MCVAYERASRAAKAGGGGLMASVGLSAEAAQELLDKAGALKTVVACDNSPTNVTIAGVSTVYRAPLVIRSYLSAANPKARADRCPVYRGGRRSLHGCAQEYAGSMPGLVFVVLIAPVSLPQLTHECGSNFETC